MVSYCESCNCLLCVRHSHLPAMLRNSALSLKLTQLIVQHRLMWVLTVARIPGASVANTVDVRSTEERRLQIQSPSWCQRMIPHQHKLREGPHKTCHHARRLMRILAQASCCAIIHFWWHFWCFYVHSERCSYKCCARSRNNFKIIALVIFAQFFWLQNSKDGGRNHGKKEGHEMRLRSSAGIKQGMLQLCTLV